jgi:amino acid transporter
MIKKNNFSSYDIPYISNSNFFSITLILISLFILVSTFNIFYGFVILFLFVILVIFTLNLPRIRKRKN